jgi:ankyrin repeat protein
MSSVTNKDSDLVGLTVKRHTILGREWMEGAAVILRQGKSSLYTKLWLDDYSHFSSSGVRQTEYDADSVFATQSFKDLTLLVAAHRGLLDIIQELLLHGANIDVQLSFAHYESPLILATISCSYECVDFLLERGAKVNSEDTYCKTALIHAAEKKDVRLVERLLAAGADVNKIGDKGSALVAAIRKIESSNDEASLGVMRSLVAAGTSIGAKVGGGYTALMWACVRNIPIVLEEVLLTPLKFELCAVDGNGMTAVHHASQQDSIEIMMALCGVEGFDECLQVRDMLWRTPLMHACAMGHLHTVQLLLMRIKDACPFVLDTRDVYGNSAVLIAADHGHADIVRQLLQAGALLSISNNNRETVGEFFLRAHFDMDNSTSWQGCVRDALCFVHYLCVHRYIALHGAELLYSDILVAESGTIESDRVELVVQCVFQNPDLCRCIMSYIFRDGHYLI